MFYHIFLSSRDPRCPIVDPVPVDPDGGPGVHGDTAHHPQNQTMFYHILSPPEILGALLSILFLWILTGVLVYMEMQRTTHKIKQYVLSHFFIFQRS